MKKSLFKLLASVNKRLLPRYSKRDITKLSKLDQGDYRFPVLGN